MNRTETYGGGRDVARTRRAKDAEMMAGLSMATLVAIGAGALAVIGLLVGLDVVSTDNPFDNGVLWLLGGTLTAIAANVFRRENHLFEPRGESTKGPEAMVNAGNSFAALAAIGAGVLGVIGLLVGFDIIGTDDPFRNGVMWLTTGIITAICANVFRREHHVLGEDETREAYDTRYEAGRETRYETGRETGRGDVGSRRG